MVEKRQFAAEGRRALRARWPARSAGPPLGGELSFLDHVAAATVSAHPSGELSFLDRVAE